VYGLFVPGVVGLSCVTKNTLISNLNL